MKRIINILFSEDKNFWLIFLAVFIFNSRWLIESAMFFITAKPVPLFLHITIVGFVYLLSLIPFVGFFKKGNKDYKFSKGIPGSFFGLLTIILYVLVYGVIMNEWAKLIPLVRESGMPMLHLAAGIFLAIVIFMAAVLVFLAGYFIVCIEYQVAWKSFGKAFTSYARIIKAKPGRFLFNIFITVLLVTAGLFADKLLKGFFNNMMPDIFISRFQYVIFFSVLGAYLFLILIRISRSMMTGQEGEFCESLSGGGLPYLLMSIFLFTIILTAFSLKNVDNGIYNYCNSVENTILRADLLYEDGQAYLAVPQYLKARSDLAAVKDFSLGLLEKKRISHDYKRLYVKGYEELSVYRNYFEKMLNGEYGGAKLDNEMTAFPEAALWSYAYYQKREEAEDKEKALQAFNRVVMQDIYVDQYSRSLKLNEEEIKKVLARIEKLELELDQRQLIYFLEKDKYENKSDLLKEMIDFAENSSKVPYLNRYIAEIAEQEGVNSYTPEIMKEYALKYYDSIDYSEDKELEIEASVFTAYKLNKSGNGNSAMEILEKLYNKYPDEPKLLAAYSYVLLENKRHEKSNQIAENIKDNRPNKYYLMAVNYLEMGDAPRSLENVEKLAGLIASSPDKMLLKEVDQYLYMYVLEFIHILSDKYRNSIYADFADISNSMEKELAKLDADTLAYKYLSGVTKWYKQDYENSNVEFAWILGKYPELVYPNLMIALNYYEKKEMEGKDYTKEAEEYLLTFVNKVPDTEEAFFTLGPIYTYRSDQLRSNRAIRRMYLILDEIGTWNDEWGLNRHASEYLSEEGVE